MALLLAAGSLLITFLAVLIITSLWRLRQDQQRWRDTREEIHRLETEKLLSFAQRLESLERRVDRIVPMGTIEVIGGKAREIGTQHHEVEGA
jgi:hypothetical protein